MALTLQRGQAPKPPIMVLYGRAGIGKTTFAAQAKNSVFVQTEDGLTSPSLANVPTFGVLDTYEKVLEAFSYICQNAATEGWQNIVIDSIDRLDPLIVEHVCRQNGWKKLEDGAYGKGRVAWRDEWRNFMTSCMAIRNEIGLGIIMLGHCKAVRVSPPDAEPYTQYALTIHEDAARILVGDSDIVGFATYPTNTVASEGAGFQKKVTRAITDKPRLLLKETGAQISKSRYGTPDWLPFDFATLAQYVPTWAAALPPATAQAASTTAA